MVQIGSNPKHCYAYRNPDRPNSPVLWCNWFSNATSGSFTFQSIN